MYHTKEVRRDDHGHHGTAPDQVIEWREFDGAVVDIAGRPIFIVIHGPDRQFTGMQTDAYGQLYGATD